jgi:hypothetical protein
MHRYINNTAGRDKGRKSRLRLRLRKGRLRLRKRRLMVL